tara:strand:+ start:386 stop:820 length:435 start_codon:yes stop_codon:yes gene_type:complete
MAKLGRYAANRFKTEALAANKTVDVSDCGTMFMYSETASFTSIQLPTVAEAGAGWWCRVVVTSMNGGADVDCSIKQSTSDSNNIVKVRFLDGSGGSVTQTAGDGVTIIGNTAVVGDYVELWCDGTTWHGVAVCSAAGGLVKYDA